jgi:NAD(P)-dependent dehydrogenase (short-subunit alcohol dehydrogenase family)/acyl carrier protein
MVLLADGGGVAAKLAPLLTARGCLTSVVAAGSGPGSADRPVDLDADVVVQLGGLDEDRDGDPIARVRHAQARGFDSVVALVRALSTAPSQAVRVRKVVLVTDRAVDVTGRERLRPEQAMLHGLARVVAQEYPGLACRTVDVTVAELAGDATALGLLADELSAGSSEPSVALRGQHRWLPGFELLQPDPVTPSRLRPGGTYLITGGLGRIGLALAEDLARRVHANLVLVARTELPARSHWDAISDGDPRGATVRRLLAIEHADGAVLPVAADVADRAAMADALVQAERRFGALDGVVHAAGAVGPAAFAPVGQLDADLIGRHFRPKIEGTLVLDELLGDRPLTLAMLTSSLAAVLGGAGFGAYAAANAFLDAFAAGPGQGRWTSVGWEGWDFRPTPDPRGLARLALSPEEGTEVFGRLTALSPRPRVTVSTGDLPARVATWVQLDVLGEQAPAPPAAPASPQHARPQLATGYVPPGSAVERTVAGVWQELLGIAEIGRHDDFFALGGHSLLAIQIISRLRDAFEVELSLHSLFDGPTVAELAAGIERGRSVRTDDNERLTALLDLVEGLSEEEVEALLAAEDGGRGE